MEQPEKPAPTTEKEEGKKSTSENKGAKENKINPFSLLLIWPIFMILVLMTE